jgi:tetratricopeptide (TPR) repeat protein
MRPDKKWFLPFLMLCSSSLMAQQPDLTSLRETIRTFQRQGDYDNAVLVLNKALQQYPDNADLLKDLAYTEYLQQDLKQAKQTIDPLLERPDADVQAYQIAGNIYKGMGDARECDKLYKKGLKRFPKSGALHAEYGELLFFAQKDREGAIATWEEGIRTEPSYAGNYYHAARYYHAGESWAWALFYGEVFINLESLSTRTAEIKSMLADAYKKFFLNVNTPATPGAKANAFETAYRTILAKQSDLTATGVTADNLTMIRTRFLLEWFDGPGKKFPHKLFEQQQWMVKEGLFEAYNQWVFGVTGNIVAFQNWTATHAEAYATFTKYHRNRTFKVPEGQYYH